ncbi:MAG: radical SAM protein [Bacteroidales bacterium]|nr:radical SAM protein [Bacteroidales bacterium]
MPDNERTYKRYTGNKIKWIINECCNFQCNYCSLWHNDHKQISNPVDLVKLAEAMDYLGKDWFFCITGGEPFLEKNFVDICREITKKHYIGLITNLSTPNVYDFADTIDPEKCTSVITSVHITEREKKDNGLKQYIDKMLYMQKRGFNISADYVAYPLLCQRMVNDFEYLRSNGIQKINFKLFFGRFDGKDYPDAYTQDIRELIQKNDSDCFENEILAQKSTGFYRKLCHAGNRFFLMNRKGECLPWTSIRRIGVWTLDILSP